LTSGSESVIEIVQSRGYGFAILNLFRWPLFYCDGFFTRSFRLNLAVSRLCH